MLVDELNAVPPKIAVPPASPASRPTLVVDFGSWATAAAVVFGDQVGLVAEPTAGSVRWPSAACRGPGDGRGDLLVSVAAQQHRDARTDGYLESIRGAVESPTPLWLGDRAVTGQEVLSAYLSAVRTEGERVHGRIERLVLTMPATYGGPGVRRDLLVGVATAAGFPDVELVAEPLAAALDPAIAAGWPDGSLLLVCDLGASWTVTAVEVRRGQPVMLGYETSGAGKEFDALLVEDLRATLREWVEPLLSAGGPTGARARYHVADFVRRLKHRLADADETGDRLAPAAPPYRLTRAALERYAEPALRWMLASCRAVLARSGVTLSDVSSVLLVGGGSRLTLAKPVLERGLGLAVRHPAEPELAVIRGAAHWAADTTGRRVAASQPTWRAEPLCWDIPHGPARLVRWLAADGQHYPAGALLAQVRTADDRVFDLTAAREGILLERRVQPGAPVASGTVAAMARSVSVFARDRPTSRHQLHVDGDWLLTPDHRLLVECPRTGAYARIRAIATGAVVSEVRPERHGVQPRRGKVFLRPGAGPALIAWDGAGRFFVWDLQSGNLLANFRDAAPPLAVLVDEAHWRLVAEADRKVHVGRYRRDVATVWNLATGERIEELTGQDLHRHYTGYAARSAADGFATETLSPDGRLRATARTGDAASVALQDTETDQEVFRTDATAARTMRTAFSADGGHLLANWESEQTSWVQVWRI